MQRQPRRRTAHLQFENLEGRQMLSVTHPALHHGNAPAEVASFNAQPDRMKKQHNPQSPPFLSQVQLMSQQTVSTVPSNGDVNPYGVAYVPANFPRGGLLNSGDILVSNFNNS